MTRRKIHLHCDELKSLGIDSFYSCVNTPQKLIGALNVIVPGFEKRAIELQGAFHIIATDAEGKKVVQSSNETANLCWSDEMTDVHIIPVISGQAPAILYAMGVTIAAYGAVVYYTAYVVISLALAAIVQALAPTPKGGAGREAADSTPSFLFNGAVNVQEQGYMHPIVFGIHETGSVVISVAVTTEDIPINGGQAPSPTTPPAFNPNSYLDDEEDL